MRKTIRTCAATLALGVAMAAAPAASAQEADIGAAEMTAPDAVAPDPDAPDASAPDPAARGRVILETNCSRCHAIGMEDQSRHEEAPPFRVVVTRYPPENLAEALAEGIVSGHPDMPEFVFEPAEIEAILAYLGTLTPPEESPEETPETEPQ
jgi:mono/diheme cytochrome c family protein